MAAVKLPDRAWAQLRYGLVAILLLLAAASPLSAVDAPADERVIRAFLFRNEAASERVEGFAPHEKINVALDIRPLPSGDYTLHTEWYNPLGDLQEKTSYRFSHSETGPFSARSWLTLKRAGFVEKLFSVSYTSGYHVKFFGTWTVKLFLNGDEIADLKFEVH